jgi:hypothetical protein
MIAKVYQRRQQSLVPFLVPFVCRCAQILHVCIALFQGIPQSRLLGLIQKTHLASAVNPRFVDSPHGILL